MKKLLDLISEEVKKAFAEAGYEEELGRVTVSNRPDLCEYQCNGAMAGAKKYHKAPIVIAGEVAEKLKESAVFSEAVSAAPGFLNLKVKEEFLADYLKEMGEASKFGVSEPGSSHVKVSHNTFASSPSRQPQRWREHLRTATEKKGS